MSLQISRARARLGVGFWLIALGATLIGMLILAIAAGSVSIPTGDVWAILWHGLGGSIEPWWTPAREAIVLESRLPRALSAAAVGASLAVAGAASQAVTRNPLADPYLLGVSSGAGFGVVVVMLLGVGTGIGAWFALPLAAFLGGLVPLAAALLIGGTMRSATAMILTGVAMAQIFSALITFCMLVIAAEHQLAGVLHWIAGGFADARWRSLLIPLVALLSVGTLLVLTGRRLDLLHAGEDGAAALGMNVLRFRILILLGVSLLAGSSVAVAGGIGFVGLLVPHVATLLVGVSARRLLPVSAMLGAVVLVSADLGARVVSRSYELPVGVVTALVGAPIFVVMLWRSQRMAAR